MSDVLWSQNKALLEEEWALSHKRLQQSLKQTSYYFPIQGINWKISLEKIVLVINSWKDNVGL